MLHHHADVGLLLRNDDVLHVLLADTLVSRKTTVSLAVRDGAVTSELVKRAAVQEALVEAVINSIHAHLR